MCCVLCAVHLSLPLDLNTIDKSQIGSPHNKPECARIGYKRNLHLYDPVTTVSHKPPALWSSSILFPTIHLFDDPPTYHSVPTCFAPTHPTSSYGPLVNRYPLYQSCFCSCCYSSILTGAVALPFVQYSACPMKHPMDCVHHTIYLRFRRLSSAGPGLGIDR